jgi:hypothetical protein
LIFELRQISERDKNTSANFFRELIKIPVSANWRRLARLQKSKTTIETFEKAIVSGIR